MIGRLSGILLHKQPPEVLLEVAGVGYEVEAPMSTFYNLPAVGQPVVLYTHLLVREDAHQLYGFTSESERGLFRALIRITGVGAKMALAILSGMTADEFARCVRAGDTASLVRLPGIGKKTAERLLVEMSDRVDQLPVGLPGTAAGGVVVSRPGSAADEAVSALEALGYKRVEAERMVRAVDGEDLATEELIRHALRAAVR